MYIHLYVKGLFCFISKPITDRSCIIKMHGQYVINIRFLFNKIYLKRRKCFVCSAVASGYLGHLFDSIKETGLQGLSLTHMLLLTWRQNYIKALLNLK